MRITLAHRPMWCSILPANLRISENTRYRMVFFHHFPFLIRTAKLSKNPMNTQNAIIPANTDRYTAGTTDNDLANTLIIPSAQVITTAMPANAMSKGTLSAKVRTIPSRLRLCPAPHIRNTKLPNANTNMQIICVNIPSFWAYVISNKTSYSTYLSASRSVRIVNNLPVKSFPAMLSSNASFSCVNTSSST